MHDDKLARPVKSKTNKKSLLLMQFLEKAEMTQLNPYKVDKYIEVIIFFLILTFIVIYFQTEITYNKKGNNYHHEILPSESLSYIKDGRAITIADGAYPVAMPSQDSWIEINNKKYFPLFLILLPTANDFELYPINIIDDSLLPRRGRTLALHILFGFTSDHAENTLVYAEKGNDTAAEDFKRKAFYYLVVKDGYGKMQRDYMTENNADFNALKYYRDIDHVKEELIAIYYILDFKLHNQNKISIHGIDLGRNIY